MFKKFAVTLCMLLSVVLAVGGLAGCAPNRVVEDGVVVINNGDKIYHEDTAAENQTVLKIAFTEAGYGRDWIVNQSKAFVRENREICVMLEGDPVLSNSLFTKLDSGKNLADIFIPLNSAWELYAYKGKIEPLDDLYASKPNGEGKTVKESMDSVYLDYCTLETKDGTHQYALPWNAAVTGIVYNKKMFRDNKWSVPETTAELKTLCDKILSDTKSKVKPFVYPGKIGGYFDYIGSTWWMQSVGLESYKDFWKFASAEVYNPDVAPASGKLAALEEFKKIFEIGAGYGITGSMSKDHTNAQMDFTNGLAAMIVNGNWIECESKTSRPENFEMGIMPMPFLANAYAENGTPVQYNYVTPPDYIIVPSEAKQKDLAKKFLKFTLSDDMLKAYTKDTGSPRPFAYDTENIPGISDFTKDVLKIRRESVSYFDFSRENIYMNGHVKKYMGDLYSQIVRGDATPDRLCNMEYAEADRNWQDWIK